MSLSAYNAAGKPNHPVTADTGVEIGTLALLKDEAVLRRLPLRQSDAVIQGPGGGSRATPNVWLTDIVSACVMYICQLSRLLFGTAMNEDVEELRDRYNHLVSLAATHHKTIRMNFLHISRLEHAVEKIASYSRILATSVNELWTGMENVYHMGVVLQTLPALESAVNSVLHTNALVI